MKLSSKMKHLFPQWIDKEKEIEKEEEKKKKKKKEEKKEKEEEKLMKKKEEPIILPNKQIDRKFKATSKNSRNFQICNEASLDLV